MFPLFHSKYTLDGILQLIGSVFAFLVAHEIMNVLQLVVT